MEEFQFEFEGVRWGLDCPVAVTGDGFDAGSDEWTLQAVQVPANIAMAFGNMTLDTATWAWQIHTNDSLSFAEALEDLAELARAWRAKMSPLEGRNAVYPLRYRFGDRERVIFGRPVGWQDNFSQGAPLGLVEAELQFKRADTLFYGAEERSTTISTTPAENLGLISPLESPLTSLRATAENPGVIISDEIGGNAPAPFTARFHGPILNPRLASGRWEIGLDATIGANEWVDVTTYPWGIRAQRQDGANVSSWISTDTRLARVRLDPNTGEHLRLFGVSLTGSATVDVRWRPAYFTI